MNKQTLIPPYLFAFSLLAVMVLGQLYLFTHQIEHTLEGDDHACLVCELAEHQADAITPFIPVAIAPSGNVAGESYLYTYSNNHKSHYLSRAPPAYFSI